MKKLRRVPTLDIIREGIQQANAVHRRFFTSVAKPEGLHYSVIASSGMYVCPFCSGMNSEPLNMIHLRTCPNASRVEFVAGL